MSVKFLEQLATFEMVPLSVIKSEPGQEKISAMGSTTIVYDVPFSENVYVEFNHYYFWKSKPNKLSGIL